MEPTDKQKAIFRGLEHRYNYYKAHGANVEHCSIPRPTKYLMAYLLEHRIDTSTIERSFRKAWPSEIAARDYFDPASKKLKPELRAKIIESFKADYGTAACDPAYAPGFTPSDELLNIGLDDIEKLCAPHINCNTAAPGASAAELCGRTIAEVKRPNRFDAAVARLEQQALHDKQFEEIKRQQEQIAQILTEKIGAKTKILGTNIVIVKGAFNAPAEIHKALGRHDQCKLQSLLDLQARGRLVFKGLELKKTLFGKDRKPLTKIIIHTSTNPDAMTTDTYQKIKAVLETEDFRAAITQDHRGERYDQVSAQSQSLTNLAKLQADMELEDDATIGGPKDFVGLSDNTGYYKKRLNTFDDVSKLAASKDGEKLYIEVQKYRSRPFIIISRCSTGTVAGKRNYFKA